MLVHIIVFEVNIVILLVIFQPIHQHHHHQQHHLRHRHHHQPRDAPNPRSHHGSCHTAPVAFPPRLVVGGGGGPHHRRHRRTGGHRDDVDDGVHHSFSLGSGRRVRRGGLDHSRRDRGLAVLGGGRGTGGVFPVTPPGPCLEDKVNYKH